MKKDTIVLQQILTSNRDLLLRLNRYGDRDYIQGDDVMLITIGKPQTSLGVEIEDRVTLHYSPSTYKITGFTIICFKDWYLEHSKKQEKPKAKFTINLDLIGALGLRDLSIASFAV